MRTLLISTVLSACLLTAACADGPRSAEAVGEAPFTVSSDIPYMTHDGVPYLLDVYVPANDAPWPVVVAFHGLSSAGKNAGSNTVVVEAAAAQGMLVVAPTWLGGDPFPLTIDDIEQPAPIGNCAVAFAQRQAAALGGDPDHTVVYGFSAGTEPAILAALSPGDEPIPGCEVETPPGPVRGALLGDGEYFLHSESFDGAFNGDLEGMRSQVALRTDPAAWDGDPDLEFSIWAAAEGTGARAIDEQPDETGWLATRDPSGTIRADLERLGRLDDGVVDYVDAAHLLAYRLSAAGIDVTLDILPGGHDTSDKVDELVASLQALASG